MTTLTPEQRAELKRLCQKVVALDDLEVGREVYPLDVEFAKAARTALPSLLDEVERLERERNDYKDAACRIEDLRRRKAAESALRAQQEVTKLWRERIEDEKQTRKEIADMNCYAAGYSDGTIDALGTCTCEVLALPPSPADTGEEK